MYYIISKLIYIMLIQMSFSQNGRSARLLHAALRQRSLGLAHLLHLSARGGLRLGPPRPHRYLHHTKQRLRTGLRRKLHAGRRGPTGDARRPHANRGRYGLLIYDVYMHIGIYLYITTQSSV